MTKIENLTSFKNPIRVNNPVIREGSKESEYQQFMFAKI